MLWQHAGVCEGDGQRLEAMRLKLISCQVFCREIAQVMKHSPHEIEVEFLSKGLHEIPCTEMSRRLQESVDRATGFDAVALAYGFCNHGIAGLRANDVPLILMRAHDCIDVLLGRSRAAQYRGQNPGAYFQSSGWIEHRKNPAELEALSLAHRHSLYASHDELASRYGDDNAAYLRDILGDHTKHYSRLAYIHCGTVRDDDYALQTEAEAVRRGWAFDQMPADLSLLQKLVNGSWNSNEFLIVQPGQIVAASYDDQLIQTEPTHL
jgi:hypothetical protein